MKLIKTSHSVARGELLVPELGLVFILKKCIINVPEIEVLIKPYCNAINYFEYFGNKIIMTLACVLIVMGIYKHSFLWALAWTAVLMGGYFLIGMLVYKLIHRALIKKLTAKKILDSTRNAEWADVK